MEELKTAHIKEFYACPSCGRAIKKTEMKFNNPDDYIDYKISVHCQENVEKIKNLFSKIAEELSEILEMTA